MLVMQKLPPAATLHKLSPDDRTLVLDALFEPSGYLHSLVVDEFGKVQFSSYDEIIANVGNKLHALSESTSTHDTQTLHSILHSHPRLGARKVESIHSQAEQASLQSGDRREALVLAELNELYERTFPGLCYVTFVNNRPRSTIMQDMLDRIQRKDQKTEEVDAINAMCDIARDRARKLTL